VHEEAEGKDRLVKRKHEEKENEQDAQDAGGPAGNVFPVHIMIISGPRSFGIQLLFLPKSLFQINIEPVRKRADVDQNIREFEINGSAIPLFVRFHARAFSNGLEQLTHFFSEEQALFQRRSIRKAAFLFHSPNVGMEVSHGGIVGEGRHKGSHEIVKS